MVVKEKYLNGLNVFARDQILVHIELNWIKLNGIELTDRKRKACCDDAQKHTDSDKERELHIKQTVLKIEL